LYRRDEAVIATTTKNRENKFFPLLNAIFAFIVGWALAHCITAPNGKESRKAYPSVGTMFHMSYMRLFLYKTVIL